MARHAAVDLSQVLGAGLDPNVNRLPEPDFDRLVAAGGDLLRDVDRDKLTKLRGSYEPNIAALSGLLSMALPPWLPADGEDDWQSSPWGDAASTIED